MRGFFGQPSKARLERLPSPDQVAAGKHGRIARYGPREPTFQAYPIAGAQLPAERVRPSWSADWPPDALVWLWPKLFSGRGRFDGWLMVPVTIFALANAGLITMRMWEQGKNRGQPRRNSLVWVQPSPGTPQPKAIAQSPPPWLTPVLLNHIWRNPGINTVELHNGWAYTLAAADARGCVVERRARGSQPPSLTAALAVTEPAAQALGSDWEAFGQQHPALRKKLIRMNQDRSGS